VLIAAVIVGLLTAYYLGLRAGVTAAAVAGGAFLVAAVVPPLATLAYLAVGIGVAAVCFIGPRRERPPSSRRALMWLRHTAGRYWKSGKK
jgi:hypothetical protein